MTSIQTKRLKRIIKKMKISGVDIREVKKETVITYKDHSALLLSEGREAVMSVERLDKEYGAEIIVTLPETKFILFQWFYDNGYKDSSFKEVYILPDCERCRDDHSLKIPSAVVVLSSGKPANACPEHSQGMKVLRIYVEVKND